MPLFLSSARVLHRFQSSRFLFGSTEKIPNFAPLQRGASNTQAEIIPSEPDAVSTDVGIAGDCRTSSVRILNLAEGSLICDFANKLLSFFGRIAQPALFALPLIFIMVFI